MEGATTRSVAGDSEVEVEKVCLVLNSGRCVGCLVDNGRRVRNVERTS